MAGAGLRGVRKAERALLRAAPGREQPAQALADGSLARSPALGRGARLRGRAERRTPRGGAPRAARSGMHPAHRGRAGDCRDRGDALAPGNAYHRLVVARAVLVHYEEPDRDVAELRGEPQLRAVFLLALAEPRDFDRVEVAGRRLQS